MHRKIVYPTKSIKDICSNIDAIFVLNLKDRTDRFKQIHAEFDKIPGLKERVHIICSDRESRDNFDRACYESHLYATKLASSKSYKNSIIFEDDFVLSCDFFRRLISLIKRLPCDYLRLMLGHIPIFPAFSIKTGLFYGPSQCCTCYLFSLKYAHWMPDWEGIGEVAKSQMGWLSAKIPGKGIDKKMNVIANDTYLSIPSLVYVNETTGRSTDHLGMFWDTKNGHVALNQGKQLSIFLTSMQGQTALQYAPFVVYCVLFFVIILAFAFVSFAPWQA